MFYQLQSCTNLENLISEKEKVPSMPKNLSVTTSISDFGGVGLPVAVLELKR